MELLEAIQMYWRNSGCMENTVPDPLSEEDVNGMINSFAKHVSPCSKRCQGCGLEWLDTENMSFHRTKVFIEKVKNSNQYIFNPALEHIKYDSKVVGRQGEFCHQQNFKCGNLTVWLAVCDGCMPENEAEQFMHGVEKASEKNQTVLLCNKCHGDKNWCGFKKFDDIMFRS